MAEEDAAGAPQSDGVLDRADVGHKVVRGGALRGAGFVFANLLTAVGAILLLRHLGVSDFGRFGTVMALLAIVQGISDAGLTMTGSRELSVRSDPEDRRDVLAHVLSLRIVLTAIGVVVALAFAIIAGYDRTMVLGTLLAGAGIFLISVQSAMLLPLSIELRNGTLALNEVLRQALLVVAWAALVAAGAGLLWFFGAQLLAGIGLVLAVPLLLARHHLVAPRWSASRLRDLAGIALPVAISTVLGVLYLRMLVILMSLLSDNADQVGYYVTSTRIVELFAGLPFLLMTVTLPVLSVAARDDEARLDYVTQRTTEVLVLGGVLIVLVLVVAARPIVQLLGGSEYLPAAQVLQIQSLALLTVFLTAAWNPTLLGLGRVQSLAVCSGVGLIAVLVSGLILIPLHEADGAAAAAVIADAVLCGATFVALHRAGPGGRLPLGGVGRIGLAALVAGAAALLLRPLDDVVAAGVVAAIFLGCALALRAVPPELFAALRRFRHGDGAAAG